MMTITRMDIGQSHLFEVLRVDHAPTAQATSHPVELGAEVTDHVQVMPYAFVVEAYVTETPNLVPIPAAVEQAKLFLEGALGKQLTVVIPGEGTFTSYVLESFRHSKTAVAGRGITMQFKQVRIAAGLSVAIPPRMPAPVAAAGAPSEQALGTQAATAGTPSSLAYNGLGAMLGWAP